MFHLRERIREAKASKKGKFELVVAIWSMFLFLLIFVVASMVLIYFMKEGKAGLMGEKNGAEAESTQDPEPVNEEGLEKTTDTALDDNDDLNIGGEELLEEGLEDETETDGQAMDEVVYALGNVNLRSSAGLEGTILFKLPKDAVAVMLEEVEDDWFKIYYNGIVGYVKGEFLTTKKPDALTDAFQDIE